MKKYFISLLLVSAVNLAYSQVKKKIFYNENLEEITESSFHKQKNFEKNLDIYFENDTIMISFLVKRKNYGKLDESNFKKLKKNLSPDKELINKITKDYLKKLNKICDYNHFWVYKDDENLKYYHPKEVKWEKDNNQFIEKTFFEFHYPCFSAVIIDENGKFISYFGEFGKSTIWELTTELINKKE